MNGYRGRLCLVHPAMEVDEGRTGLFDRSDDDLMRLTRGGCDAAFDVLVRRYQAHVLTVAGRLLGRSALAPDIAQNTFVAIYCARERYEAQGKFPSYLYSVLLNQCRMARRSARTLAETLGAAGQGAVTETDAPEEVILARERQREVELALLQLGQKLQEVVVLRYSAGLGYDEIAQTLSAPVGTIKRRLFEAMGRLRRRLGDA